jgi:Bacterial PH domain
VTHYRNPHFSQMMMLVAVVFALGGILIAATRPETTSFAGRWAPAAVIVAMSTFVYLRLARAGVYAGEEGIRVVNPLRTVEIPWPHLIRFTARPHKGFPLIGFAQRVDGTEVKLWGVQARSGSSGAMKVCEDLIAELNERLAQVRSSSAA